MKNNTRFYKIIATRKYLQQGGMGMDYQKFVNNASFTIFVAVVLVEKWLERSRKVGSKQGRAKKKLLLIALESVWFHLSRLCLA